MPPGPFSTSSNTCSYLPCGNIRRPPGASWSSNAWGICGALIATLLAAQSAGLGDTAPVADARPVSGAKGERGRRASAAGRPRSALTAAGVAAILGALATAAFAVNELRGSRGIAASLIELRAAMSETGERAQLDRAAVADLAAAASKQLPWDDHAPRIQWSKTGM